jgi:lipopolysaccharide transport system ATP-binding protein
MLRPVISVENLAKCYVIGHRHEGNRFSGHTDLREVIRREARNAVRKAIDIVSGRQVVEGDSVEEYWAINNVSFEVHEGEVLGIIGRNGAGKSTLLKVLSRITEPTSGRVTLRGRVASLLEVGTGFHPELTGRENIFLNGAILGMTRTEIRKKFDEIVAFAEVEKFLDTPVKRYSSGMYVRLAFAVAAHLEPEILVIDEVLAVGDAEFQKKCIGKIDDVSRSEGRTVLFVSHNMAAVSQLAHRALLLENGRVEANGRTSDIVSVYLSKGSQQPVYISPLGEHEEAPHIARAEVTTSRKGGVQDVGEPLEVSVWVRHLRPLVQGHLGVQIITQSQTGAANLYAYPPDCIFGRRPGSTLIRFHIPKLHLNIGHFHLRIWLTEPPSSTDYQIYETIDACGFEVVSHQLLSWWSSETCIYHEKFSVSIDAEGPKALSPKTEGWKAEVIPGN